MFLFLFLKLEAAEILQNGNDNFATWYAENELHIKSKPNNPIFFCRSAKTILSTKFFTSLFLTIFISFLFSFVVCSFYKFLFNLFIHFFYFLYFFFAILPWLDVFMYSDNRVAKLFITSVRLLAGKSTKFLNDWISCWKWGRLLFLCGDYGLWPLGITVFGVWNRQTNWRHFSWKGDKVRQITTILTLIHRRIIRSF